MRMSALAVSGLLASCAPVADSGLGGREGPPQARQCFSTSQVNNFRPGRANQLFLRVGRDEVYELNAAGACTRINVTNQLAVIPDGMIGTQLCTGDWARVVAPGSGAGTAVCRARVSRRLTEAEIAALPSRQRP